MPENRIENRMKLMRQSSMCFWFPKIVDVLPTPKTVIIEILHEKLSKFTYGEAPFPPEFKDNIFHNARLIGYPLFLRTDQASGKHRWTQTCYVEKESDLMQHIFNVLEFNEMADMPGLPYKALVVRQYIPLFSTFKAFSGMPVAKERRYFVKNGKVVCHHPYWIQDAIEKGISHKPPLPRNWKQLLADLNRETLQEIQELSAYAEVFANRVHGFWSVDFAYTQDGHWILIDAGRGEISWHPKCELSSLKNRKRMRDLRLNTSTCGRHRGGHA